MLAFRHARSWHFFADAAQLFTAGSGVEGAGLDLYRVHPEFQFGPIGYRTSGERHTSAQCPITLSLQTLSR